MERSESARVRASAIFMESPPALLLDKIAHVFYDVTVISTENSKSEALTSAGSNVRIAQISKDASFDLRRALEQGLELSPDSEYFLVFSFADSLAISEKKLKSSVSVGIDFQSFAHGKILVLSRKYVLYLAQSNEYPSAANAIKNRYIARMSVPEMVRSPRSAIRQYWTLIKFVSVGLSGVLVNLAVLSFLTPIIGAVIANIISQEASIVSNFVWNDRFTFKQIGEGVFSRPRFFRFVKYNLVCLLSLGFNELIFYILYTHGVYYITSSLLATALAFVISYFGSSRWAWSPSTAKG